MKIIFFLAFVAGLLFPGCKNSDRTINIAGKISDKSTGAPIAGRNIIVQGLVERNDSLVPAEAGSFSTDSSGSFSYPLRKIKSARTYNFCFVGDSDYYFRAERVDLSFIEKNAKQLSFSLEKLADLTILILKQSKTFITDTLFLSWKTEGIDAGTPYLYKINNNGLTSSSKLEWIGGNVKSEVKTKAFADRRTLIRWVLYREGKQKEIVDTIICRRDFENKVYFKY
jgi:hypothetical protein